MKLSATGILIFALAFIVSLSCFSQTPAAAARDKSNIEKFTEKSGGLLEKTYLSIGSVGGVKVEVLVLTDLMVNSKITGVRFEMEKVTSYSTSTKVAFLDQDEIDGLAKSLGILKAKVFQSKRDTYTEINFRSRSGFEAGAFYDTDKGKWATFMKLERFEDRKS